MCNGFIGGAGAVLRTLPRMVPFIKPAVAAGRLELVNSWMIKFLPTSYHPFDTDVRPGTGGN